MRVYDYEEIFAQEDIDIQDPESVMAFMAKIDPELSMMLSEDFKKTMYRLMEVS